MAEIELRDVAKATGTHPVRISETLIKLGRNPGNAGRRGQVLSVADAIRVTLVRRCMDVGLTMEAAVSIVQQLRDEDFKSIIAEERRMWLAITPEPSDPGRVVFTLADFAEMASIMDGAAPSVRVIDVYRAVGDVLFEAMERAKAAAKSKGADVKSYVSRDRQISGVVVDGLSIAVLQNGRGKRMKLTPAEAKALGERLIAVAEEYGASALENLN